MLTDRTVGGGVGVDGPHHMVHAGKLWFGAFTATVAANTSVQAIFKTPSSSSESIHFYFYADVASPAKLQFFEKAQPSTSTGATTVSVFNSYRDYNTVNTTNCQFVAYPTTTIGATSTGTLLNSQIVGSSNNGLAGSGQFEEYILAGATTYLLQVMNANGANTNDISLGVYFYQAAAQGGATG